MQPSLNSFFEDERTIAEIEKQRRICVALWAWAYEKHADPLVSDAKFDATSEEIDPKIHTGNKLLDDFFKNEFAACTGQWVLSHPETDKLEAIYKYLKRSGVLAIMQKKAYT